MVNFLHNHGFWSKIIELVIDSIYSIKFLVKLLLVSQLMMLNN